MNQIDPTLLSEVRKYGRFDVTGCYNCGSCVISCNLSSDPAPFPRRIIQYVLLGLKNTLLSSPEPWLCHDCGDCSATCPRQTEPREAMMTVRRYLTAQYDWTGISSMIYRSKLGEIVALSIVAAITLLLLFWYHIYYVSLPLTDFTSTSMGLEHMFPKIKYYTLTVYLLPLLILITNAFRMYWVTMHGDTSVKVPIHLYLTEAKTYILQSVTHREFTKCKEETIKMGRRRSHWLLALGYVIMSIILVFFLRWFQTDTIYPIYHPQRWLGYFATVFLIYGSAVILIGRISKSREIYKFSELSDWTFPILLLLTALSGIAVHIFRYMELPLATHYTYALHLVICTPMLVITVPFGKWAHVVYRPLALYLQAVKEKALQHQVGTVTELAPQGGLETP